MDHPYLMFLGDVADQLAAKTADGIVHWREHWCVGQVRLPGCAADVRLPDMSLEDGVERGAKTMIVGVVNSGGFLPEHWIQSIAHAMELGMDIAAGLHVKLKEIPELSETATKTGRSIFDVRHPTQSFDTGKGTKRPGKRMLAVGTDCSVGKMYTALAFEKEMTKRGLTAQFCATGQTGIFIAGDGVSIDAVVSDFVSGAVEWLSPATAPDHWSLIEGQGSLFHPSYAGVSLGLLHGAQPDVLVLCHEPTRTHMRGLPEQPLPGLQECIDLNVTTARLTNPAAHCIGLSINTAALSADEAVAYLAKTEDALGLPCADPFRTGVGALVDRLP
jgi:uncharacterized NAD-dependent epimerase/dehydratase family protein